MHGENHRGERSGWLRAAVLGADDGIVSTASLMIGVVAASASQRGLDRDLAMKVARQLSASDVLGAHTRDELGHQEASRARPLQAALVSAGSFAVAACVPIVALGLASSGVRIPFIGGAALLGLGILGAVGGHLGGAPRVKASIRVLLGGSLAMGITALVGRLFGAVVS
jgi:vacuolar iron transporter family protein